MGEWKKTGCVLCAQNCGLEVQTEGHRIIKVRADRGNLRSQGYMCRKGAHVAYHQNNGERLTQPLKRTDKGFQEISWEQAFAEIGAMHPGDAKRLNLTDGQKVKITTEAASEVIELEITDEMRKGQVAIPHGFCLFHNGEAFGVNVNRLTKNTHRDPFAATPLHRYVPCRVEALFKIGQNLFVKLFVTIQRMPPVNKHVFFVRRSLCLVMESLRSVNQNGMSAANTLNEEPRTKNGFDHRRHLSPSCRRHVALDSYPGGKISALESASGR